VGGRALSFCFLFFFFSSRVLSLISNRYPRATSIEYRARARAYDNVIEDTFAYASASLLSLLNTDLRLMDQLRSIKNYFCMQVRCHR
jgi:hypothetical protein